MRQDFSPKQVARVLGVSESSLKRWCDGGLIGMHKTVGGHRRIAHHEVLRFLRDTRHTAAEPELLGLVSASSVATSSLENARLELAVALERADGPTVVGIGLSLYVAGHTLPTIFDEVYAPAFHTIGRRWHSGELDIFQERHAVELTTRFLGTLRATLPPPPADAPLAIGATLSGDVYTLPLHMAELVLRERGYAAEALGAGIPSANVANAARKLKPRLVWISTSHIPAVEAFVADVNALAGELEGLQIPLVLGGQALVDVVRTRLRYSAFGDSMGHLASLAANLLR